KLWAVGVSVSAAGSSPVPDSEARSTRVPSDTVSVADLVPALFGLNQTVMSQSPPGCRRPTPQPFWLMAKSAAFAPSMVAPAGPSGAPPALMTVNVAGAGVPSFTTGKKL